MHPKITKIFTLRAESKILNLFVDDVTNDVCVVAGGPDPQSRIIYTCDPTGEKMENKAFTSAFNQAFGYSRPYLLFTGPGTGAPGPSQGVLILNTDTGKPVFTDPLISPDSPGEVPAAMAEIINSCLRPSAVKRIPSTVHESEEEFESIKSTMAGRYGLDCRWQAEYLEVGNLLFISCYIYRENSMENNLYVIDTSTGTLTPVASIEKNAKGIGEPPFMVQHNTLYLIAEKTELHIFSFMAD